MSRLTWDDPQGRFFEAGVDHGVFYPQDAPGVPWKGLISVQEAPSDGDILDIFVDGMKVSHDRASESYAATIGAYDSPVEFDDYEGADRAFDFSYRSLVENQDEGLSGYKIHLVYGAIAAPSSRNFQSLRTDPTLTPLSWNLTTKPVAVPGTRGLAHLVVDTRYAYAWATAELERILYGDDTSLASMPTPDQVIAIFENASILKVIDNGDGTATITGPDTAVVPLTSDSYLIQWPSVIELDYYTVRVSSL